MNHTQQDLIERALLEAETIREVDRMREHRGPRDYRVTWGIDVCAYSPREAARLAHEYQQRPTTATVFDVHDGQESVRVDLMEDSDDA